MALRLAALVAIVVVTGSLLTEVLAQSKSKRSDCSRSECEAACLVIDCFDYCSATYCSPPACPAYEKEVAACERSCRRCKRP
jgi:hypothetical protein